MLIIKKLEKLHISLTDNFYLVEGETVRPLKCDCKCHFGGAVSCPGCKDNHEAGHECEHCK